MYGKPDHQGTSLTCSATSFSVPRIRPSRSGSKVEETEAAGWSGHCDYRTMPATWDRNEGHMCEFAGCIHRIAERVERR